MTSSEQNFSETLKITVLISYHTNYKYISSNNTPLLKVKASSKFIKWLISTNYDNLEEYRLAEYIFLDTTITDFT